MNANDHFCLLATLKHILVKTNKSTLWVPIEENLSSKAASREQELPVYQASCDLLIGFLFTNYNENKTSYN